MNKDTMIILAAAAFGLWFVTKATRATPTANGAASLNAGGSVVVPNALKNVFGVSVPNGQAGWQYFSDGSAIGPDGAKYSNSY
jgi:hypothetical protein